MNELLYTFGMVFIALAFGTAIGGGLLVWYLERRERNKTLKLSPRDHSKHESQLKWLIKERRK